MFKVDKITKNNQSFLLLQNESGSTQAKICLNEGGRLVALKFKNTVVINENILGNYKTTYGSALLFPFANRIENGHYTFNDVNYSLPCNEAGRNNALHGLVYNKTFNESIVKPKQKSVAVTLNFNEVNRVDGFPFLYNIAVTYKLMQKNLHVIVQIKNTDSRSFPFTLGWHPYFYTSNLQVSVLKFKSDKKVVFNDNLITKKLTKIKLKTGLKIEAKQLDDCFVLNNKSLKFITPTYRIKLRTNQNENYLQLYTPKNNTAIAIEPMTGICNSFNNKIGLQTLAPNNTYKLKWKIAFTKTNM